jgi:FAD dependent oxidoreductase TIGR03364
MQHYDLAIVGGGVLGTFHAYHALQKGLRVALFEKNMAPQGATVRNFGQIVPSGFHVRWQQYGRRSLDIYKSIQAKFDISVRQNGSIYLASNDDEMTLLEELSVINRANDYPSQLLTAEQCLARYAGVRSDYVRGGLFFPEEITLEPRIAIHRLLWYLIEQHHLAYYPDTLVCDLQPGANTCEVATTDGRRFAAQRVIVCSGSEFRTLFPHVFASSDLVGVKIQMLETHPQPQDTLPGSILTGLSIRRYECFSECPSWAAIKRREAPDSPEKRWGVHILFKQTTSGSVIVGDSHEYADATRIDELGFDQNQDIDEFMLEKARQIVHLADWRIARRWFGIYTQCRNSDIFLHQPDPRIHIVTGIGGKGMTGSAGFAEQHLQQILEQG